MKKKSFQITPKFAMGTIALLVLGILAFVVGVLDFRQVRGVFVNRSIIYVLSSLLGFVSLQIIVGIVWKRARIWGLLVGSSLVLYAGILTTICMEMHSLKAVWYALLFLVTGGVIGMGVNFLIQRYSRIFRIIGMIILALIVGSGVFILGYDGFKEGGNRLLNIFWALRSPITIVFGALFWGQILLGCIWKSTRRWGLMALYVSMIIAVISAQVISYAILASNIVRQHSNTFQNGPEIHYEMKNRLE